MVNFSTESFIREIGNGYQVGTKGTGEHANYTGPVADVAADDDWLYITTDEYEGAAMLNIEALPFLILALQKIAETRQAATSAT